ncbi:hypothetical protein NC651_014696 [Populus alba x Populus x berolinensis]|nr:hypothetical protein NC651_014696 [Populus alba x Populus x berolinensis]
MFNGFNNVFEVRTKVGLSSDAEALIDSGGVDDGSAQEVEVAETTVTHSRKVEGESSFKIEEEVKGGGTVA